MPFLSWVKYHCSKRNVQILATSHSMVRRRLHVLNQAGKKKFSLSFVFEKFSILQKSFFSFADVINGKKEAFQKKTVSISGIVVKCRLILQFYFIFLNKMRIPTNLKTKIYDEKKIFFVSVNCTEICWDVTIVHKLGCLTKMDFSTRCCGKTQINFESNRLSFQWDERRLDMFIPNKPIIVNYWTVLEPIYCYPKSTLQAISFEIWICEEVLCVLVFWMRTQCINVVDSKAAHPFMHVYISDEYHRSNALDR